MLSPFLIQCAFFRYFVFFSFSSAGCGGSFTGTTGIITSPTHPDLYPHSIHCLYVIEVPSGSVVRLTFSSFFLESHSSCSFDYVEVYDNSTTTGNALLGRLVLTWLDFPSFSLHSFFEGGGGNSSIIFNMQETCYFFESINKPGH